MRAIRSCLFVCLGMCMWNAARGATLRVPAATAYLEPDVDGARVSERGIRRWDNPKLKVLWYGEFKQTGTVDCSLELRLPAGVESKLRLSVGAESREATARGPGTGGVETNVVLHFGEFELGTTGYQKFVLQSLNPNGTVFGDPLALILTGGPVEEAHFNLKPRRNAASVHLSYVPPTKTNVVALYCEVTAVEDPVWTFYMACGWHRGYFGMQVNSETERRIIFSVWDSGNEAVDRAKVRSEDRVRLMGKGKDVYTGDFGNEGTGGHSHLKYLWKTGEKQRFVITARPTDETHTIYSGYYFHPENKSWMLISSWQAPKEGGFLRGLHSFSENFGGANGHLQRKALYGNQWIRVWNGGKTAEDGAQGMSTLPEGEWVEVDTATFSHDPTGREDRRDRFMGVESGEFFLSHGGFVPGFTKFGEKFQRPKTGKPPVDIVLP